MKTTVSRSCLDAFVQAQTAEPFYYSQAWHDLISRVYGFRILPLTTTDATGQVCGFLPLCYLRSRLTGSRFVSLPFSDNCPLLAADAHSANALVDQAIRLTAAKRAKYLELRTGCHDVLAKRADLVAGNMYVRSAKTLSTDPEALWRSLGSSVRYEIRKAEKQGVQVRLAQQRQEMEQYYRLHLLTRSKKHGVPAQPRRYFYELWDTFASSGTLQLWLAEYHHTIIAASICLSSGTTCRYAYNASDARYLHLAPNYLLEWTAISWAAMNGYRVFDLGRTSTDNKGLMDFKRRFGAAAEPLPYYYHPSVGGALSTAESSRTYQILSTNWRRLPLAVAGPLGGYLYPHLA